MRAKFKRGKRIMNSVTKMLPVAAASELVSVGNEAYKDIAVALTRSARLGATCLASRNAIARARKSASK